MSYRNLDLGNGTVLKYSIGRTHVKIHGMEAIEKSKIGTPIVEAGEITDYQVTPFMIRSYLNGQ